MALHPVPSPDFAPRPSSAIRLALATIALALLLVPSAGAFTESDVPLLRSDVASLTRTPEIVKPHEHFSYDLHLTPDSRILMAAYQVCEVGKACYGPPQAAMPMHMDDPGRRAFRADTARFMPEGQPLDFQAGQWLGIRWILHVPGPDGNITSVSFPPETTDGLNATLPPCLRPDCQDRHYFVVQVAPGSAREAFGPMPLMAVAAVAAALVVAARNRA